MQGQERRYEKPKPQSAEHGASTVSAAIGCNVKEPKVQIPFVSQGSICSRSHGACIDLTQVRFRIWRWPTRFGTEARSAEIRRSRIRIGSREVHAVDAENGHGVDALGALMSKIIAKHVNCFRRERSALARPLAEPR